MEVRVPVFILVDAALNDRQYPGVVFVTLTLLAIPDDTFIRRRSECDLPARLEW